MRRRLYVLLTAILLTSVFGAVLFSAASASNSNGQGYACTRQLQDFSVVPCPDDPGNCEAHYFMIFAERWGCELVDYNSTCTGERVPRFIMSQCVQSTADANKCIPSFNWLTYYMRACR